MTIPNVALSLFLTMYAQNCTPAHVFGVKRKAFSQCSATLCVVTLDSPS